MSEVPFVSSRRNPTLVLLDSVFDSFVTRDDMALDYAAGIRYHRERVDWPRVNAAIIERWSQSALEYIKREAWKRV